MFVRARVCLPVCVFVAPFLPPSIAGLPSRAMGDGGARNSHASHRHNSNNCRVVGVYSGAAANWRQKEREKKRGHSALGPKGTLLFKLANQPLVSYSRKKSLSLSLSLPTFYRSSIPSAGNSNGGQRKLGGSLSHFCLLVCSLGQRLIDCQPKESDSMAEWLFLCASI